MCECNNIIIYAKTHQEDEDKVLRTYKRLSKARLRLQIDKCEFITPEVTYLGHKTDRTEPDLTQEK